MEEAWIVKVNRGFVNFEVTLSMPRSLIHFLPEPDSAFFWLLSLLLASAIWFMAKSSRETFTSTIIYTVLLQEVFRWFLFLLIK